LAGAHPRRLILLDPPPALPKQLPLHKTASSIRTAATGVLLISLRIETARELLEQLPQLRSLPEAALACFIAAQQLSTGVAAEGVASLAGQLERQLRLYRQCRHALHVLSANVQTLRSELQDDIPALLMVLSTERDTTFRELFPGIEEDCLDPYGRSAVLPFRGGHIAVINRCLHNKLSDFMTALEIFSSDCADQIWWWFSHIMPGSSSSAHLQERTNAQQHHGHGHGHGHGHRPRAPNISKAVDEVTLQLIGNACSDDADVPLLEMGLDSLGVVEFRSQLSGRLGLMLAPTFVFDFPTLRQIRGALQQLADEPTSPQVTCFQDILQAGAEDNRQHLQAQNAESRMPPSTCTLCFLPGADGSFFHFKAMEAWLTALGYHGLHLPVSGNPTLVQWTEQCLQKIEPRLNGTNAIALVGYSGGGLLAMALCEKMLQVEFHCDAVVLLDPASWLAINEAGPLLQDRIIASSVLDIVPSLFDARRFRHAATEIFPSYVSRYEEAASVRSALDGIDTTQVQSFASAMSDVPVLMLTSTEDHPVFNGIAGRAAEEVFIPLLPHAQVVRVAHTNHLNFPYSESVIAEVLLFFAVVNLRSTSFSCEQLGRGRAAFVETNGVMSLARQSFLASWQRQFAACDWSYPERNATRSTQMSMEAVLHCAGCARYQDAFERFGFDDIIFLQIFESEALAGLARAVGLPEPDVGRLCQLLQGQL